MWTIYYQGRFCGTYILSAAEITARIGPWLVWDFERKRVHVTRWPVQL